MKSLYDVGEAAFVANVGPLVEPVTRFNLASRRRPPSLFAHNKQKHEAHSVHSGELFPKGVLGRIADALVSQERPFKIGSYSLAG
eukprot:CAMPEP_0119379072 /NCGR_PEP_ID=MMETSP1334-20130426/51213_1 /TAXON_ID=127549 /ORGANISM="Calcidiscus leptoporus, Strain RCC1130" /LENGTH=84 /DNA_ID=CAMNT_0007398473 /DNA_START=42 /DNA_END=292 /DNA_ORIENTATION=+